jgi:hypothetical protein
VMMENSSTAQLAINRVNRMSFMGRHINVELFTEGPGGGNTGRRGDDGRNRGPNQSKRSRSRSRDRSPCYHRRKYHFPHFPLR